MHSRDHRCFCVYILTKIGRRLFMSELPITCAGVFGEPKFGNGSEFCKRYKIDRLVYYESFDDVRNAIDREKRIKGWLRIKKTRLVVSVNPTWIDLSEGWYERHLYSAEECMGPSLRSG